MQLSQDKIDRLEGLRHYGTLYELRVTNGTQSYLLTYCRKTKPGLRDAVLRPISGQKRRIDFLCEVTSTTPDSWVWAGGASVKSGEWIVSFSGRTERDAIVAGELVRVTKANQSQIAA